MESLWFSKTQHPNVVIRQDSGKFKTISRHKVRIPTIEVSIGEQNKYFIPYTNPEIVKTAQQETFTY